MPLFLLTDRTMGTIATRPTGARSLARIEAEVREKPDIGGQRTHIAEDQRVAVGIRADHAAGPDRRAAAGHVLDDDGLAEDFAHAPGDDPGQHVRRAPGRGRDHECDRAGSESSRPLRRARTKQQPRMRRSLTSSSSPPVRRI